MQKKLAPWCVLMHEPTLFRQEFWRLFERLLGQGMSIVMTSAYLDDSERCQKALLLDQGHVLASGSSAEMRTAYSDSGAGAFCGLRRTCSTTARWARRSCAQVDGER